MAEHDSVRCMAVALSGQRCKQRTTRGDFCWIHAQNQLGLRVRPSAVHGYGLFARKPPKGKTNADVAIPHQNGDRVITEYKGERLTQAQHHARYPNDDARYTLQANNNVYVDARRTTSGFGRFANDAGSHAAANSKYTCGGNPVRCNIKTLPRKNIRYNDEIKVWYGNAYGQHGH